MYKIVGTLLMALTLSGSQLIEISKIEQQKLGIQTQEIESASEISLGRFNAKVVPAQEDIVFITSKVAGIVEKIDLQKFAQVKKGQRVLTLRSPQLLELQRAYLDAQIESGVAKQNYERDKELEKKGVIATKRLKESQRLFESAKLLEEANAAQLLMQGFSQRELQNLKRRQKVELTSGVYAPLSGQIISQDVAVGEYVSPSKTLLGVYSQGEYYLEITLPLSVAKKLSLGDVCSFEDEKAPLLSLGEIVDEATQSVIARVKLQNAHSRRVNEIVQVKISKALKEGYRVAKPSLVFLDGESFVFLEVSEGMKLVAVKILGEEAQSYIVSSKELQKSSRVALNSTATLLSALKSKR